MQSADQFDYMYREQKYPSINCTTAAISVVISYRIAMYRTHGNHAVFRCLLDNVNQYQTLLEVSLSTNLDL